MVWAQARRWMVLIILTGRACRIFLMYMENLWLENYGKYVDVRFIENILLFGQNI